MQRTRFLVGSFPPEEPEVLRAGVVSKSEEAQTPTSSWTKAQIIEYLDEAGIEYQSSDTKADLLEKV